MSTIELDFVFSVIPGTPDHPMLPLTGIVPGPFTLDLGADGILSPTEETTVTSGNGTVYDVTYEGTTSGTGDPVFTLVGDTFPPEAAFILSDTNHPLGTPAGQLVVEDFVCFLAGTRIATPTGEVAVETLAVGDPVLTADGRCIPVKWVGRQTCWIRFGISEGRRPVSIAAGALGDNLPIRELRVTSDHALLIDDVLVHAGALVNGTTIRRIPPAELGERFVVYHIETENHEIVLAEGAPAETFIDNVTRGRFDNYAEYEALYGAAPAAMQELPQPRAMSRRQVHPTIHARLAAIAASLLTGKGEQAA